MKIGCVSFSEAGRDIGDRLSRIKDSNYTISHYYNKDIEGGIKTILKSLWDNNEGLVFISSTGIAIRLIHDHIKNKNSDPGLVVVDDMGKFAISLLSGHLGGANALASFIGEEIGALPVITTASDNRGIGALDLFAKENFYYIEDKKYLTKIMGLMVDGKKIGFYTEDNKIIDYDNLEMISIENDILKDSFKEKNLEALVMVTSSKFDLSQIEIPSILLRPKNINIGLGCKRGVKGEKIISAIYEALDKENLSPKSIKAIGTVEVKKDEEGLIQASNHFSSPLIIFSLEEIKSVEEKFPKSNFVKNTIGVFSVADPSSYLLGGEVIRERQAYDGITISIRKEIKND